MLSTRRRGRPWSLIVGVEMDISGGASRRPAHLAALPAVDRETIIEINPGIVLGIIDPSDGDPSGGVADRRLRVCRCVKSDWQCDKDPNGDTWCREICISWECEEIPAGGRRNLQ